MGCWHIAKNKDINVHLPKNEMQTVNGIFMQLPLSHLPFLVSISYVQEICVYIIIYIYVYITMP